MPKKTERAAAVAEIEEEEAVKKTKRRKSQEALEVEEKVEEEVPDKKKRKKGSSAQENPDMDTEDKQCSAKTHDAVEQPKTEETGLTAEDADAAKASKKQARKQAKKAAKKQKKQAEKEAKQQEAASRAKRNEALRKKGQMTKKEKYMAAKAAKKAEAQKNEQSAAPKSGEALEVQAPAAPLDVDKLDPRAVQCFLTGLPYMATEKHVTDHFAQIGTCMVELLRDANTGKSTGKGFLTFKKAEHAMKATTEYNGTRIQNRWVKIRLCEVRDIGKRPLPWDGPGERPEGCLSAVVKCDKAVSEDQLWAFFEDCNVAGVSCMTDRETGEFRGMAFLDFSDGADVDRAVAKSGQSLGRPGSRPCLVRYKNERPAEAASESKEAAAPEKKKKAAASGGDGRIAEHNRAPPVPPPCGKATKFDDSDEEDDDE